MFNDTKVSDTIDFIPDYQVKNRKKKRYFTHEEIEEQRDELKYHVDRITDLKEEKKAQNSYFTGAINEQEEKAKSVSEKIDEGGVWIDVACRTFDDINNNKKYFIEIETGELIGIDPLYQDDNNMFLGEPDKITIVSNEPYGIEELIYYDPEDDIASDIWLIDPDAKIIEKIFIPKSKILKIDHSIFPIFPRLPLYHLSEDYLKSIAGPEPEIEPMPEGQIVSNRASIEIINE
jgi:hypothetical protein